MKTENGTTPRMLTIRQVAATGILPENALRGMVKRGEVPCIFIGAKRKALINYDLLVKMLEEL